MDSWSWDLLQNHWEPMATELLSPADRIRLTVGPYCFTGRFERHAAPGSVALLRGLLPLESGAMHARWSGEAAWSPLDAGVKFPPENATAFPHPGQILLYAGTRSEPELLIPYGACSFACRAGQLAGNHVVTLDDVTGLRELGEALLTQGAQPLRLTAEDPKR